MLKVASREPSVEPRILRALLIGVLALDSVKAATRGRGSEGHTSENISSSARPGLSRSRLRGYRPVTGQAE